MTLPYLRVDLSGLPREKKYRENDRLIPGAAAPPGHFLLIWLGTSGNIWGIRFDDSSATDRAFSSPATNV